MKRYPYIIIGAGAAGRTAAEILASAPDGRASSQNSVLLVSGEEGLPYKRTQVSKRIASGFNPDDLAVKEASRYAEEGIDLRTGIPVEGVNPGPRTILLDDEPIEYGALLLATGAKPAVPFGAVPPDRATALWRADDGVALRRALDGKRSVIVVGNGVLGVETAWQLSQMGLDTTLTGRGTRIMSGYLDDFCSGKLLSAAEEAGVRVRSGRDAAEIVPDGPRGVVVRDARGTVEAADFAVIAAGSEPEISLARTAGLRVGRGVVVDACLRTSEPGTWAAGDCAEHPGGRVTGLWHDAERQGRLAAESMLGRNVRNDAYPFRLKCEVFGGYWFSAGPVTEPVDEDGLGPAETWEADGIAWRLRFRDGRLGALAAAAESGMDKTTARAAQALIADGAGRKECSAVLLDGRFPPNSG